MKRLLLAIALLTLTTGLAAAEDKISATIFKNPGCTCCDRYANYLRANGIDVAVLENPNMTAIKQSHGVQAAVETSG